MPCASKGSNAHKAAGKIQPDIERGLIRAGVIRWEDLVKYGSEARCREVGKLAEPGDEPDRGIAVTLRACLTR